MAKLDEGRQQSVAGVALDASRHFVITGLIAAVLGGLAADHAIGSFDGVPRPLGTALDKVAVS